MKAAAYVLFLSLLAVSGCLEAPSPVPQPEASENLIEPVLSSTKSSPEIKSSGAGYDRKRALYYIRRYAEDPNPKFAYCANWSRTLPADCTNFASQVLWYGGVGQSYSGSEYNGWWYNGGCTSRGSSKSWRQVNDLLYYLIVETDIGQVKYDPKTLRVGDVIFYKLRREENGWMCDSRFFYNHTAVVSGHDAGGNPLVAYHSNEVLDSPWASRSSRADLGHACSAVLVHIRD